MSIMQKIYTYIPMSIGIKGIPTQNKHNQILTRKAYAQYPHESYNARNHKISPIVNRFLCKSFSHVS